MEPLDTRARILQEDPEGDSLRARLSRPLGRADWIRFAGLVPICAGVVVGQLWPPGYGLGLVVFGAMGVAFNAILMKPWMRRILGPHADRIGGLLALAFGVALMVAGFPPGSDR